MQRINTIETNTADAKATDLLANVKSSLGMVPNIFATMANSSELLEAYLGFSGALGGSSLSAKLNEQIALVVAGENNCDYCASAHTALGSMAGVSGDEMALNLAGRSADPKTQLVLNFASEIVSSKGNVNDDSLAIMRSNGFSDREILEIFGQVMANIFTNYFNHLVGTEIDFPIVSTQAAVAA